MNFALILSGGSGTRLWPLSRRAKPKHLISLAGGKPLLEQTLDRLDGLIPPGNRYLITIPEQAPIVRDIARGKAVGIIIEPIGLNNLLPMALSTRIIAERDPDACVAFLPADHSITQPGKLTEALRVAFKAARDGYVVTIGIPTRYPEPSYGHLKRGKVLKEFDTGEFKVFEVELFREKPPLTDAVEFHENTQWFWNGGIFIFSVATMNSLISKYQPELEKIVNQLKASLTSHEPSIDNPVIDWESDTQIREAYINLPNKFHTSIDYALMEKAEKVATIPVEMGWSDLGGFAALADLIDPLDDEGNRVAPGSSEEIPRTVLTGCSNVSLFPGRRAVVCIDCDDLIIVETPDALLVLKRDSSGRVRDIVETLRSRGWTDLL